MEDISKCEVITVPDDKVVNKPIAFVVVKEGILPTEELKSKILSYCELHVPEYMVPADIIYLEDIPLNAGKKPDLKELERIYNEGIKLTVKKVKKR